MASPLLSVEQFGQMTTADTESYELVAGVLVPLESGTFSHNSLRGQLGCLLWTYFKVSPIGEVVAGVDCQINRDTVRRPDLSIFFNERRRQIDVEKIPVPFPPDIAIEVLSPSETAVDVRRKVREYLGAGSKEVWLLDPANHEASIYSQAGVRLLEATSVLESPLLPGFTTPLADLV